MKFLVSPSTITPASLAVPIPRDDSWFNDKAAILYLMLFANHILSLVIVVAVHMYNSNNQLLISELSIFALCFTLVVILQVSSRWIFDEEIMGVCFEDHKTMLFTFWTIIELLVFLSSIFSNMLWLFCRTITTNVTDLMPFNSLMNEKTDHLQANVVIMGFVECISTPLIIGTVLMSQNDVFTLEQTSEGLQHILIIMYNFQKVQTVGVVFINFVKYYKYQGWWVRNYYCAQIRNMIWIPRQFSRLMKK